MTLFTDESSSQENDKIVTPDQEGSSQNRTNAGGDASSGHYDENDSNAIFNAVDGDVLDEFELMDIDRENNQNSGDLNLPSRAQQTQSSTLNSLDNNQIPNSTRQNPISIGNDSPKPLSLNSSQTQSPHQGEVVDRIKGKQKKFSDQTSATSTGNLKQSSLMMSKHAHITLQNLKDEEQATELLINNLRTELRNTITSTDPNRFDVIKGINENLSVLKSMLVGLRADIAYKEEALTPTSNNSMVSTRNNAYHSIKVNTKFKIPMDKIPKFDIELFNYATQTYKLKQADASVEVSHHTVEQFIEAFENAFIFYESDIEQHWEKALCQSFAMSSDEAPRAWLPHELRYHKKKYTCWDDMKRRLLSKYMETFTTFDYTLQLYALHQSFGETILDFLQRFIILMAKASIADSRQMAIMCYGSMLPYVRDYLKMKLPVLRNTAIDSDPILENENLQSLTELLEGHAHTVHRELAELHQIEHNKRKAKNEKKRFIADLSEETPSAKRLDQGNTKITPNTSSVNINAIADKALCGHCQRVKWFHGHQCPEGDEFYRLRDERRKIKMSGGGNHTGTFAVRRRSFHEHLANNHNEQPYTVANHPSGRQVNMVKANNSRSSSEQKKVVEPLQEGLDDAARVLTQILKNKHAANIMSDEADLMELIMNEDDTSEALIDSGSDISILTSQLCNKYDIAIHPSSNIQITLANNDNVSLLGKTDDLLIKYNGRNVSHSFFVMHELGNGQNSLFGCDMFSKLGISLAGVAYNWDDNKVLYDDAIVDEQYQPNISNAGTESEHARLLKAIEPAVQRNQAIDVHELCPHPLALIKLDTIPDETRARRQYKIAEKLMPVFDETVKDWLEKGIIKRAPPSPWNNPVTFAPKRKGDGTMSWRTCLDVRDLNSILVKSSLDNYSIKLPSDIFKQATGAAIYSCIDVATAYLRLPLFLPDQVKTSFQHRNTAYCFQACPYGITYIGSAWSRLLDDILGDLPYCLSYIDDVYCITKTDDMDLHAKQLEIIINRLTENKLILNMAKAHIGKTAIVVLGQNLSRQGRSICSKRLTNICDVPYPTHPKALKSCLGMFTYMRDHCPMASELTWRLDALRNIGDAVPIQWTPELKHDFDTIKEVLASKLVLSPFDPSLPLIVAVDASDHALGTCLFQEMVYTQAGDNNTPHSDEAHPVTITKIRYVAFHSRSLSKSERNWHVQRRELAAIAMALKMYDDFLFGRHFTLYSDHRSLTYLFTQSPINVHFVDYFDTLLRHSFDIRHLSGLQNVLPDFLSRLYYTADTLAEGEEGDGKSKVYQQRKGFTIQDTTKKTSYKPSNIGVSVYDESKRLVAFAQAAHKFSEQNYVIVPEPDRKNLLKDIHKESGHFGADNIVKTIRNQNMNWPGILQDAIDIVSGCPTCIKFNIKKKGYSPARSVYCYLPGDGYAMDLAGPFSSKTNLYSYLLVMVDVCTRFVILKPLVDKTAKSVAAAMIEAFGIVGLPRFFVVSDHGTEWSNQLHSMLFQSMQIEKRYSTQYHPEGNGVSERYVGLVKKTLAKLLNGNVEDWHHYLPLCALLINNKISKKLQSSPFSLMYARNMNAPINYYDPQGRLRSKQYMSNDEMLKRIDYMGQLVFPAISERHQAYTDKLNGKINEKHVQVNFKPGTYVMHKILNKTNAFAPSYVGPYQVIRQNDGGAYILRDEEGMLLSRNYVASELKAINQEEVIPKSELFEVEAIIQDNGDPQNREYLVKWKNYSKEHNSWVKTDDFTDADCIIDYWKKVKRDQSGKLVDIKRIVKDKRKQIRNHQKKEFAPSHLFHEIIESPALNEERQINHDDTTFATSKQNIGHDIKQNAVAPTKPLPTIDVNNNRRRKNQNPGSASNRRITRQMASQNVPLSSANLTEIVVSKRKSGPFEGPHKQYKSSYKQPNKRSKQ
ncbi:hypothetical protein [Parasitella parasitica]|uniref:RNA-directed DNA polymerase n=1 Tax=Parasitella parasitica TaxID=35722 RepID=A0A0B7NNG4_9FUNG|nr:hypothetical protein [Parasitella parasitica]